MTDCKKCTHGINCINGRWCQVLRMYVEHKVINNCKNYKSR